MEKNTQLFNSTVQMYENTLREMKERGASEADIKLVQDALTSFKNAVDAEEKDNRQFKTCLDDCVPYKTNLGKVVSIPDLLRMPAPTSPLKTNLFILKIGDIPFYLPSYFYQEVSKKKLKIEFRETAEFSPFDYLNKNKKFKEIQLEFLDRIGRIIRVETFSDVKLYNVSRGSLSYFTDEIVFSTATFKYKKHGITTCKEERDLPKAEVKDSQEEEEDCKNN